MNIKHFFRFHEWETISDDVTVIGYTIPHRTEVIRSTTKLCKVCGKIKSTKKVLESYNFLLNKKERNLLSSKIAKALGVKAFYNGEF